MSPLYEIFKQHPQVTTDSRNIPAGSIFFALRGASFDGNRFAADALEKGASYAVIDDPGVIGEHPALGDRLILVEESLSALQALAREHRRALGLPILAIAGSNGKTTTKELTAAVLSQKYRVYATRGNLNNHIGVPLTLLAMDAETEFGIEEMGASACGEIALLCSIAEPDYGLLTNIGHAHLEGFGGPEGIRRGKGELFDFLAAHNGRAFIPKEDEILTLMAQERPGMAVESYSRQIADKAENQLEGEFNRLNIAASLAVGRFFGVDKALMRTAIAAYHPSNHRSQRTPTERNTLILDCYNANPSSMAAALGHFAGEGAAPHARKVLILGDMRELGAWSAEEHTAILRQALMMADAELHLVGSDFAQAYETLQPAGAIHCHATCAELINRLKAEPITDALILIKGSRSIGLEQVIPYL